MVSESSLHSNMNKAILILCMLGISQCSPVEQTVIFNEDGSYRFNFDTGKDAGSHFREETRHADGTVIGRYSYEDPTGSLRTVNYRAGRQGFVATGDVGVIGAAPAQVPAVVPPVPISEEEPDQDIKPVNEPSPKPEDPLQQDVVPEQVISTTAPPPEANDVTPKPKDDSIKVLIPDDQSRKREAGSPSVPIQYADEGYPFQAPLFGKRRLDVPDEDVAEKPQSGAAIDDEPEKSPESVKPPTSFVYQFGNPFIPQFHHKPATQFVSQSTPQVAPQSTPQITPQFHYQPSPVFSHGQQVPVDIKKPEAVPEINPMKYFYYVPTSSAFNYFPGVQNIDSKFQQPAVQSHFHSGPPKAWAYVPLSSLPQQQQPLPAAQPQTLPTTWAYIQPHAVTYIPADSKPEQPKEVVPNPHISSPSAPEVHSAPVQSPETSNVQIPPEKIEQVPVQPAFQRPTVQHYHFKGPSDSYGYYYQY